MKPLSLPEARVLGSLIEKAMTTPDYYPLTTNALMAACNQSTSRDPVVDFDQSIIEDALRSLDERGLVGLTRSSGGRTLKYVHKVESSLMIDTEQASLLAVLLLRGPQTPGELRSRTTRYAEFPSVEAIEQTLTDLMTRTEPLIARLPRDPGQKEDRYRTLLLEGAPAESPSPALSPVGVPPEDIERRVAELEQKVAELETMLGIDGD